MKDNIQNELNYVSNPDRYIDIKQDNKIIPTRLSYYASAQAKILGYNNYEDMLKSGHNLDTSESYEKPLTAREAFINLNHIVGSSIMRNNSLEGLWSCRIINPENPGNIISIDVSGRDNLSYTLKIIKDKEVVNVFNETNTIYKDDLYKGLKIANKAADVKLGSIIDDAAKQLRLTNSNIRVYADYEDLSLDDYNALVGNINFDIQPQTPSTQQSRYIRKTKAEYAAEQKDKLNGINKTIEDIAKTYKDNPEEIAELMKFASKFYRYSSRNVMLVHNQNSGATYFQSFEAWKKAGYSINRGQHGLKVLVPLKTTYLQDKDGNYVKLSEAPAELKNKYMKAPDSVKHINRTYYKIGNVFDISQTNVPKEEYPSFYSMGYNDVKLDILSAGIKNYCVSKLNIPVNNIDMNSISLRGYHIKDTLINMNDKLNSTEYLSTLTHEVGHAVMQHTAGQNTYLKEFEADCFSIMLESHLGVEITESRKHHLADNYRQLEQSQEGEEIDINSVINDVMKTFSNVIENIDEYVNYEINQNKDKEIDEAIDEDIEDEAVSESSLCKKQLMPQNVIDQQPQLEVG